MDQIMRVIIRLHQKVKAIISLKKLYLLIPRPHIIALFVEAFSCSRIPFFSTTLSWKRERRNLQNKQLGTAGKDRGQAYGRFIQEIVIMLISYPKECRLKKLKKQGKKENVPKLTLASLRANKVFKRNLTTTKKLAKREKNCGSWHFDLGKTIC